MAGNRIKVERYLRSKGNHDRIRWLLNRCSKIEKLELNMNITVYRESLEIVHDAMASVGVQVLVISGIAGIDRTSVLVHFSHFYLFILSAIIAGNHCSTFSEITSWPSFGIMSSSASNCMMRTIILFYRVS